MACYPAIFPDVNRSTSYIFLIKRAQLRRNCSYDISPGAMVGMTNLKCQRFFETCPSEAIAHFGYAFHGFLDGYIDHPQLAKVCMVRRSVSWLLPSQIHRILLLFLKDAIIALCQIRLHDGPFLGFVFFWVYRSHYYFT